MTNMKTTPEMRARLRELSSSAPDADDYDRAVRALLDDFDSGVLVTGIHLTAHGGEVAVAAEVDGKWVPVITERGHSAENTISHIVEPAGIRRSVSEQQS